VVTGTFTHRNPDLHELRLGDGQVLEATGRHPLWSRTRGAWVRAAELREGELLATREGSVRVLTVRALPGVHRVYNLEVPGAHCYYAGESAVLAHNDCASGTFTGNTGEGLAPVNFTPGATTGGAGPVQAGQAGEVVSGQLTGMPKNTARIPSASGKKAFRVPDHMDDPQRHIIETKNVKKQYYSSQLKDDKAHVLRGGGPGRVDVIIDQRTTITPQLLQEHLNPGSPIKLRSADLNK
jgi:hypothetical protein